jgi:hypothetical protein
VIFLKSRAQITCEYLKELNSEVVGNYLQDVKFESPKLISMLALFMLFLQSADRIVQSRPEFFKSFNLVIVTNLLEK